MKLFIFIRCVLQCEGLQPAGRGRPLQTHEGENSGFCVCVRECLCASSPHIFEVALTNQNRSLFSFRAADLFLLFFIHDYQNLTDQ